GCDRRREHVAKNALESLILSFGRVRSWNGQETIESVDDYGLSHCTSKLGQPGPRLGASILPVRAASSRTIMWNLAKLRHLALGALPIFCSLAAYGQTQLSVPPDSPRWELQEQAKPVEYQGRKCLYLDGGAALLKDFEMRDGVIDLDVATPATRGFFG